MTNAEKPETGEEMPERLKDYYSNPSYHRRVVVFCDVLGWRNHIAAAGNDPVKIGALRRVIVRLSRAISLREQFALRLSTFSDNIAVTQPVGERTPLLLQQMANFQLAAAMTGFFLRGGITIGDVHHDSESVFGPGLNRAYELESTVARSARIVLDRDVRREFGDLGDLAVEEDGVVFLDPFRREYIEFLDHGEILHTKEVLAAAGLPAAPVRYKLEGAKVLRIILETLKEQLRSPIADKEYGKVEWLFDRIAAQLGVPPARSYPRIYPAT